MEGNFFPSDGQGYVSWCILECLWVACLLMGLCSCLACLGAASSTGRVGPGVGFRQGPSWEFSLINIPWVQEFSGGLGSN